MRAGQRFDVTMAFLSSARFVTALTTASVGTALLAFSIRQTIGWAGLFTILIIEVALFAIALIGRRGEIEWSGLLPISLMVFMGWAVLSMFWSVYQWATLGGLLYSLVFTVLGVSVALLRDTIQIVRAFGDVFRFVLLLSVAIEVLSGLLIDTPIWYLDIRGNLDRGGPIQGVLGGNDQLGVAALIALITFAMEWTTRSIRQEVAIGSMVLAAVALLFSRSPIAYGALLVVAIAAVALMLLRRLTPERRRNWQIGLLGGLGVLGVATWLARGVIIDALDATRELTSRLRLWREVWDFIPLHQLEGWGWIGHWRMELPPYYTFVPLRDDPTESAGNAWLDVWLQLGLVGLVGFIVLVVLAFTRSWLLAAKQRSVVYLWPALVLVVLVISSLAESLVLVEFGWLTLVVCTVKASRELSWRQAFSTSAPRPPELPHERPAA
ncbi:O-antigen ligase family protein [Cryobacterium sp. BB307]|uniref:O-antigen ligase family protein n=1 Tax=unclassified Cryobacterium TaxID=2649013 RepID=UPI0032C07595